MNRYKDWFSMVLFLPALLVATQVWGAELDVRVVDPKGQGVPNVVVYITAPGVDVQSLAEPVVVDQVDLQFAPHLSIVPIGTQAIFPNSDPIAHHVYSFSRPNQFVLPLYKGAEPDPVTFVHPGFVTLGCNIHDSMVGYVAVVDSNIYGLTDAAGQITLTVPQQFPRSEAQVRIWSPRLREKSDALAASAVTESVEFALTRKLRPAHQSTAGKALWQNY